MSIMINYTKSQYLAKITELEGYYGQLEQHLGRMEDYKKQMFDFWNDQNAQDAGNVLTIEIRQVRNAMDRTADLLTFYKSAVEKMGGAGSTAKAILEDALSVLGGLGI